MTILITVVHVIACITLVLVVLLQAGKGADMGAVFGGASSTVFGSSGAGNFLTRLTTGAAVVFMLTSLALTYVGTRGGHSTIMPETAVPKTATVEHANDGDSETSAVAEDGAAPAPGDAAVAPGEAAAPAAGAVPAPPDAPAAP